MDIFAAALFKLDNRSELNKLAHDLITTDSNRHEGWLAVAMFTALKEDGDRALSFVEKAGLDI